MITAQASTLIRRPLEDVFRYVSVDFFQNYPKWSPEVIELKCMSPGPVRLGTVGRQVRNDQVERLVVVQIADSNPHAPLRCP